jgi:hypothetical protein
LREIVDWRDVEEKRRREGRREIGRRGESRCPEEKERKVVV